MRTTISSLIPGVEVSVGGRRGKVNVVPPFYYHPFNPLLNIIHNSSIRAFHLVVAGDGTGIRGEVTSGPYVTNAQSFGKWAQDFGYTDSYGELIPGAVANIDSFDLVIFGASRFWASRTLKVTWDGTSVCTMTTGPTGASLDSSHMASGYVTITLPATIDNELRLRFTVPVNADPPRHLSCFEIAPSNHGALIAAGKYFRPEYVAICQSYAELRVLDWTAVTFAADAQASSIDDLNQLSNCIWYNGNQDELGRRRGAPYELFTALGNETGCGIHVNVSHKLAVETGLLGIRQIARTLRDTNTTGKPVKVEYSNEIWNYGFSEYHWLVAQAASILPSGMVNFGLRAGGFLAARMLNAFYEEYGASRRNEWVGIQPTQHAAAEVTDEFAAGVTEWLGSAENIHGLAYNDLFEELHGAPYYFDFYPTEVDRRTGNQRDFGNLSGQAFFPIYDISIGANAIIRLAGESGLTNHGLGADAIGQELALLISDNHGTVADLSYDAGSTKFFTITGLPSATQIQTDLNTTGKTFTTSPSGPTNTICRGMIGSALYRLMRASQTAFDTDPVTYADKYDFFCRELATAALLGECPSGLFGMSVLGNVSWLIGAAFDLQMAKAVALGLRYCAYEGGNTFQANSGFVGIRGTGVNEAADEFAEWCLAPMMFHPWVAMVRAYINAKWLDKGGSIFSVYSDYGFPNPAGPWQTWVYPDTETSLLKADKAVNAIRVGNPTPRIPPFVPNIPLNLKGPKAVGQQITAGTLRLLGMPTPTASYRWWRATDSAGSGATLISGATSATYTAQDGPDDDVYLRIGVTPSSSVGIGAEKLSLWYGPISGTPLASVLTPSGSFVGNSTASWAGITTDGTSLVITGPDTDPYIDATNTLIVGHTYRLEAEGYTQAGYTGNAGTLRLEEAGGAANHDIVFNNTTTAIKTLDFVASATSVRVHFFGFFSGGAGTAKIKNIKLFDLG